jgi:hypothetical protein
MTWKRLDDTVLSMMAVVFGLSAAGVPVLGQTRRALRLLREKRAEESDG